MKRSLHRTEEEFELMKKDYQNGFTNKEISKKHKSDWNYQCKIRGIKLRNTSSTKQLRINLNIQEYFNIYKYKFKNITNEEEAYILGFWFSDGWVSDKQAGLKLSIIDYSILEKIRNYICEDITIQISKNRKSCSIVLSSEEIINNLLALGCLKNKTYKKLNIPIMNKELIRHFIRGYFDGDGTIFKDGKYIRVNICSVNKEFLEDIQKLLIEEEIESNINIEIRENKIMKTPQGTSSNCKNMYRLFIRKKESLLKLKEYFYGNSNIYLDRKFLKFE